MKFPYKVVVQNKGAVTLSKQDYVAAGGEGTVCRKGGVAYKVYHDPKKVIPLAKIRDLTPLAKLGNVLGPRDILFDSKGNVPIGFTMNYVRDTEFLCRLFSKGFRADHGVGLDEMNYLVKRMQLTVEDIHSHDILIVDLNEMNFLVNGKFSDVLFIDVDSYQTKLFKATAIMESIRDRMGKAGEFTEGTDWYSFAVVAFQMYTGYHPYRKGRHPDYGPSDWSVRMDKGVSVFHPEVAMKPPWSDWSMIPPAHLGWLKAVLGPSQERYGPPLPDASAIVAVTRPVVVKGTDGFDVSLVTDYGESVHGVWFYEGVPCAVTKGGIHVGTHKVRSLKQRRGRMSLAAVPSNSPVLAIHDDYEVVFEDTSGNEVGRLAAEKAMQYGGRIYSAYNGVLTESTFMQTGPKVLHLTKSVAKVLQQSTSFFSGVAVQDILGTCWLTIPWAEGKCSNTKVPEMDGRRIVDARYERGIFMAVAESGGKYDRFVLFMNDDCSSYRLRIDEDIQDVSVHFTVLANGMCIHQTSDQEVEVFKEAGKVKVVDGPPFHTGDRLLSDGVSVLFLDGGRLYRVSLK